MPYVNPIQAAEYDKQYRIQYRIKNRDRIKAHDAKYYIDNRDKAIARQRVSHLSRNYGITPAYYDQLLAFQGGVCGVCGKVQKSGRKLAVDHDHDTGKIRGLLCQACNGRLEKFIGYLKQSNRLPNQ